MSRAAYEAHFGQPAPPGAVFGVDVTWWQSVGSYATTAGYWADFGTWADFVCVRTSYGSTGNDGAQDLHFQIAAERGYSAPMGTYHYVYPSGSAASNAANYLARSQPFLGRTTFDMLDFEENPPVSASYIDEMWDRVEQARQRPCLIYAGKSYMDQAGAISCPADRFWIAHYAAAGSNAWQPTTNWSSWDAPLMPNQYGAAYPGIWQWSSSTPQHGHLDLDISTNVDLFGGSLGVSSVTGDDFLSALTPDQQVQLYKWVEDIQHCARTVYWNVGNFDASVDTVDHTVASKLDQLHALAAQIQRETGTVYWSVGNFDPAAEKVDYTVASKLDQTLAVVRALEAGSSGTTGTVDPAEVDVAAVLKAATPEQIAANLSLAQIVAALTAKAGGHQDAAT